MDITDCAKNIFLKISEILIISLFHISALEAWKNIYNLEICWLSRTSEKQAGLFVGRITAQ